MDYLKIYKNVPLDPEYKYTIDFESATAQTNFFNTIPVLEFSDTEFEFISEFEPVKVEGSIESLKTANYMIFRNYNQTRDYYCFITRKEYVNPNCTRIYFKLDLLQTFMFDYTIGESFIEREHQDRWELINNSYQPIFNLEVENLDIGSDYRVKDRQLCLPIVTNDADINYVQSKLVWYEIITTEPVTDNAQYDPSNFQGTYQHRSQKLKEFERDLGVYVYLVPMLTGVPDDILQDYPTFYTPSPSGSRISITREIPEPFFKSTAVLSIRKLNYCPISYGITKITITTSIGNKTAYRIDFADGYEAGVTSAYFKSVNICNCENTNFGGINLYNVLPGGFLLLNLRYRDNFNYNTNIGTFINIWEQPSFDINTDKDIKNESKLLTSTYRFIQLTDYASEPLKIKPEFISKLSSGSVNIQYTQNLGIMSKSKYWVSAYNGDNGEEYNTINNTVSELSLFTDAYINYIAQNKASATTGMAINLGAGAVALGLGLATGGIGLVAGVGMALGTAQQIGNAMVKIQDIKDTPDSVRQSGNNADFENIATANKVVYKLFEIKPEFKNKIFNYFYRYGYKCNDFKVPNTRSRYYFNYIKTIEINIVTNIDSEYRKQIEDIYNNGITIWHYRNANTFKGVNNYQYENCEISIVGEHPEQEEVIING